MNYEFGKLDYVANELFHCLMGPPIAYFEYPFDRDPNRYGTFEAPSDFPHGRFVYVTLAIGMRGVMEESADALCQAMEDSFRLIRAQSKDERPYLVWRLKPQLEEGKVKRDITSYIRCRLVVPSVNIQKLKGLCSYHSEGSEIKILAEGLNRG